MKNPKPNISKKLNYGPLFYSIFLPALLLIKPQVEQQLKKECINLFSGQNIIMQEAVSKPCRALASPIADCLIREADKSNNVMKIISEILSKNFGEGSEVVTKACIAKALKIPVETLKELPLNIFFNYQQQKTAKDDNCGSRDQANDKDKPPSESKL